MEIKRFGIGKISVLTVTDSVDCSSDFGSQTVQAVVDAVEPLLDLVQPGPQRLLTQGDGFVHLWRLLAVQHSVEVVRVPSERDRKGLQGPRTAFERSASSR